MPNRVLRLPAVVVDISKSMEASSKTILGCCKSTGERDVCVVQCKKKSKKDYVSKNQKQGQKNIPHFNTTDIPFRKAKKIKDLPCPLYNFLCKVKVPSVPLCLTINKTTA